MHGGYSLKIILLPGLDGTGELFKMFALSLPSELQPVVCKYPDVEGMGYDELLDFVLKICPENEQYFVLGESFSGPIAIEIAAKKNAMLQGIVLVNTFATCPRPQLVKLCSFVPASLLTRPPKLMLKFLLDKCEPGLNPIGQLEAVLRNLSAKVIRSRLASIETVNILENANKLQVPVCLIQSNGDMVVPQRARKQLRESLIEFELHQLPGNHFGLQTYPKSAAKIVAQFCRHAVIATRSNGK